MVPKFKSFPIKLSSLNVKELFNLNILLWGQKDIDLFKEVGVNKDDNGINLLKIGSWQGSYYKDMKFSYDMKYDLLFISQLYDFFFNFEHSSFDIFLGFRGIKSRLWIIPRPVRTSPSDFPTT